MRVDRRGWSLGLVVVLCLSACAGSRSSPGAGPASPLAETSSIASSPTPAPTSTAATSLSPTGPRALGGDRLPVPAGTYSTRLFDPAFDFTIPADLGIRNSGESPAFLFIGEDLVVETPSDEFDAVVFSHVYDPVDQRTVHPAPADLMAWFLKHPGLKRVAGPVDMKVDGLPAKRADLDVVGDHPCDFNFGRQCLAFSPLENSEPFNVAGDRRIRVLVVEVKGKQVVFTYFERPDRFAANVGVFDQIVDSVAFR